ncbi:MAG: two-component system response regulator [Bacteroidetes bacterium GWF2_49_14]|nr:MAG: two-component system response regulator [Bacteroidetes bacterium GWF2_49_14]
MEKIKILLAEDDPDLGSILAQYLEIQGFMVTLARDGEEAWEMFRKSAYNICILDVMMPKMDGFEVAEKISRQSPDTPFIFLTAKSLKEDRIRGLKIGADDYICKPFEVDELVLRVNNILKRSGVQDENDFKIGQSSFNFQELLLTTPEEANKLTLKEGMLLKYFLQHENKLVKREEILTEVWGENDYFLGRSMDVFVSRLRKFLACEETVSIETVRGTGFIFRFRA